MIAAIGFMIGAYVIVRLVSFGIRRGQPREYWAVRALSGVAGLITVAVMVYLWVGPGELTRPSDRTNAAASLINAAAVGATPNVVQPTQQATGDTERMKQMLSVSLDKLEVLPQDTRAGRFSPTAQMSFTYRNTSDQTIRAFTGTVTFADLFDRPRKRVNLTYETSILPGLVFQEVRNLQLNDFINDDQWAAATPLSSMHVSFEHASILLPDGTRLGKAT